MEHYWVTMYTNYFNDTTFNVYYWHLSHRGILYPGVLMKPLAH